MLLRVSTVSTCGTTLTGCASHAAQPSSASRARSLCLVSSRYASIRTSSDSLEQIMLFSARVSGTNTCKFSKPGISFYIFTLTYCFDFRTSRRSLTGAESTNSAAISRALEALSLASWKSSFSARLISMTDLLQSQPLLSSALVQNSAQLSCKPNSKKLPVDFSSIPAMSLREQKYKSKPKKKNCPCSF
uniref:Secreted protein n=1 Tax=Felis catus TaxID=9685 RepID=A0ABI7ZPN8_FELCA